MKTDTTSIKASRVYSGTVTADTESSTVDTQGHNSLTFIVSSGTITDGAYVTKARYSDNGTDFADVPEDEYVDGTRSFAATDDNVTKQFGVVVRHRYYRALIDQTGASTGGAFTAHAVLGEPYHAPVA